MLIINSIAHMSLCLVKPQPYLNPYPSTPCTFLVKLS